MRTAIKWSFVLIGPAIIAAIPTRIASHDVAVGFPFTWHTRQEIITLGEQPHSFSLLLLLFDICLALLVLIAVAGLLRRKHALGLANNAG